MSKFSDTFTQGGQTQLHKLHMISQVVGSTLKGGGILFVMTFGLFIWFNHCWQDFWLLVCYVKAWLRVDHLSVLPKGFFDESWVVDGQGVVHTVTDFYLRHSDFYTNLVNGICISLLKKCVYSLLIAIASFFMISWFWIKMGRKKQTTKVLSGFECVAPKVLRKQIRKAGASTYRIADVPMPKNAEYQHMMVTGTTGAGKSNMIHQLLEQIRQNGDQAIILDTTGGIFARYFDEEKDLLLNPLDERTQHWNMWKEAANDHVIDEIAEAIIPDTKMMDSFWTQGARQLFSESVQFLKESNQATYKKLLDMTLKLDLRSLKRRLENTPVSVMLDPSIDKTALSIRASLVSPLKVLSHLEDTEEGLSLLQFMKTNTKDWFFLSCQTDQRAFLKSIFSVWLTLIIKGMMCRSENNGSRTWLIIDELASLNRLPSLLTGLAEIRKYGGCFVLGFQDLNQVETIYGQAQAKTLSNLTGTKILFRAIDTDVATRMARYMGEQEKEELSTSISYGAHQMRDGVNLNQQRHTKPVVTASQIMLLNDLEAYLKFPGKLSISKVIFSYLQKPPINAVYQEKPARPRAGNAELAEKSDEVCEEAMDETTTLTTIMSTSILRTLIQDESNDSNKKSQENEILFDI